MSRRRWARPWLVPTALLVACGGGSTGPSTGSLALTVSGLPSGAAASITVTGPGGYSHPVTATETISDLPEGSYTVASQTVENGGTFYTPLPASQVASIASGMTSSASVSYSTATTNLNLRVSGLYLTQSVQTLGRDVPLIKDRDGYLRVFVTANQSGATAPKARVRLYHNGQLTSEQLINPPGLLAPQAINEASLGSSWNLPVSRTLIQPNLSILVEVDPENAVIEGNESDNVFPASGIPLPLEVRTPAPFHVTLVPVKQKDNSVGNVTEANKNGFLAAAMKMYPLPGYDVLVGSVLVSDTAVVDANNTNKAWNGILEEVNARRLADNSTRYYYGVVNPPYTSGVAGVGYVGLPPSAVGWDMLPSGASVAAHEWGHNWGRQHAPCGGASNPDGGYPYSGGVIGVYGFDLETSALKPASAHDIMGYCNNEWISDYTYRGVLEYRGTSSAVAAAGSMIQPALLVWGRIVGGQMDLHPAFQIAARPVLPSRDGPYTIQGRAADGSSLFSLRFAPSEVADDRHGEKHFAFAIPLAPERASRLAGIRLLGQGRQISMLQSATAPAQVRATRTGSRRVTLEWDAAKSPMVMVRDPVTGQVVSFARGGRAVVTTDQAEISVTLSNQVQSREVRVSVPAR
jgi:CARDB